MLSDPPGSIEVKAAGSGGAAVPGWPLRIPALGVGEMAVLRWLVPLALLQGLLYLALVPPWQHYDEPTHFLYAAEIAAGEVTAPGPASAAISREIADSMYRFRFYPPEMRPDLLDPLPSSVGFDQRVHPPLYYMLVALPLRAVSALAVEQQLYVARAVSLAFYLLTIVAAWRIAVTAAPDDTRMQGLIPLLVLLAPAFADLMTAVNNDVLLNFSLTVTLLGAVLLVRDGPRPVALALALLGVAVAILAKRVALVGCLPLCLALLWAVRREPLRWWVLSLLALAGFGLFSFVCLEPVVVAGPLGPHTILAMRPWIATIADGYLRLSLDAVVRSLTDLDLVGRRYETLVLIGFGGFWGHFAWGHVTLPPLWVGVMAGLALMATIGLALGGLQARPTLELWQRRCLWLFLIAVVVAWVSLFVRLHPLPPLGVPAYIPRGRYMFWAMVPNIWLLVIGLVSVAPRPWRRAVPYLLAGLFVGLNLAAWLWAIPNAYYR